MFAPPPQITAEVLTRLPDALRRAGHPAEWAHGRPIHSFLEGPAFDPEGRLWVVDIPHGRIFRIAPAGEWQLVVEYDGWPNGLALRADGRLAIADHKRGLLLLDRASGKLEPLLARRRREAFKGLNDLIVAGTGDLYFTDQGDTGLQDPSGRLCRLRPDGRLDILLASVPSPNGLVLTPAEDILYLAVTRANQIWRVPLLEDGEVGRVGVFLQLQGGLAGPDGLARQPRDRPQRPRLCMAGRPAGRAAAAHPRAGRAGAHQSRLRAARRAAALPDRIRDRRSAGRRPRRPPTPGARGGASGPRCRARSAPGRRAVRRPRPRPARSRNAPA